MLPFTVSKAFGHAAFHSLESLWACCPSLSLEPLACCLSRPREPLGMMPFAVLRACGHAAFPPPCVPFGMLPFTVFRAFGHAAFPSLCVRFSMLPLEPLGMFPHLVCPPACCLALQEAQLGIRRTSTIPVRFKQMVSDCLSPTTSLKPSKHHKLAEVDVDTPPARLMSDPMLDHGEEEEVQSSCQQPGIADGQSQAKRLRVTTAVRHMHVT